jgi:ATP-dependent helicase/nuclease subunit A
VEVAFCFLEAPEAPVSARFTTGDEPALARRLRELQGGIAAGRWPVAPVPDRELCGGCPGRGTLCVHPLEATRRAPGEATEGRASATAAAVRRLDPAPGPAPKAPPHKAPPDPTSEVDLPVEDLRLF